MQGQVPPTAASGEHRLVADDGLLVKREACFERAPGRARLGDLLQALDLSVGEPVRQVDAHQCLSGRRLRVVDDLDAHILQLPSPVPGVEIDHCGDARCEHRWQQLVRCRPQIRSTEPLGLIRDDRVAAVDVDLVAKSAVNCVGYCGNRHTDIVGEPD